MADRPLTIDLDRLWSYRLAAIIRRGLEDAALEVPDLAAEFGSPDSFLNTVLIDHRQFGTFEIIVRRA